MSPPGRNRPPCDNFTRGYPDRPPSRRVARVLCDRDGLLLTRVESPLWRALPVLGGSSSRLQLVDKSVELRARLPPSADNPFIIGEFVAHDSSPQFGSLNHRGSAKRNAPGPARCGAYRQKRTSTCRQPLLNPSKMTQNGLHNCCAPAITS
jgi:hypothetical protein